MSAISRPSVAAAAVPACLPVTPDWRTRPPTEQQQAAVYALFAAFKARSRLIRGEYLDCLPEQLADEFLVVLFKRLLSCDLCGKAILKEGIGGTVQADELSDTLYLFVSHQRCLGVSPTDTVWTKLEVRARREFKRCYLAATGEVGAA